MNILLIGTGGREHALAWKIAQSPLLDTLFIASGNGGTHKLGEHVNLNVGDHAAVVSFCQQNSVGLVVVGPEAPLVDGLADSLRAAADQAESFASRCCQVLGGERRRCGGAQAGEGGGLENRCDGS